MAAPSSYLAMDELFISLGMASPSAVTRCAAIWFSRLPKTSSGSSRSALSCSSSSSFDSICLYARAAIFVILLWRANPSPGATVSNIVLMLMSSCRYALILSTGSDV